MTSGRDVDRDYWKSYYGWKLLFQTDKLLSAGCLKSLCETIQNKKEQDKSQRIQLLELFRKQLRKKKDRVSHVSNYQYRLVNSTKV